MKFFVLLVAACISRPHPIPAGNDTDGGSDTAAVVTDTAQDSGPVLELSDDEIDFGSITVGDSDTQEITIRNAGDTVLEDVSIDFDSFDSDQFWVDDNCPRELEPGDECSVEVEFAPQYVDDFSGEIEIRTSAGDASVDVTGSGEAE